MMASKVSENFVKASSENLPNVDIFMVSNFLKRDDRFNIIETKGVQANKASRESYGDNAIGYVEVKREDSICTMKAKICPEHRNRSKPYVVEMVINEKDDEIIDVKCFDCVAAFGGCKHALAFLMWTHRRSEQPSPTDVECYWKKPKLSKIIGSQVVEVRDFMKGGQSAIRTVPDNTFFRDVMNVAQHKKINSMITRYYCPGVDETKMLSIHQMMMAFKEAGGITPEEFIVFAKQKMSNELCQKIENLTRDQSQSPLWHEIRYARITASKIHEAARCKTIDGYFVKSIIGAKKVKPTKAILRGQQLEGLVLVEVENKLNIKLEKCGLFLLPEYPIFGASPDSITNELIVEIKCPSSEKAMNNYIKHGEITDKYKAQMNLQMLATNKEKGLFCVARPDFETSKEYIHVFIDYDEDFCKNLMIKSEEFWKKNIFPKLFGNC